MDLAACTPLSFIARWVCYFHCVFWRTELWYHSDRFVSTSPARHSWNDAKYKQARELAGGLSHRLAFARRHCDFVHHCSPPKLSSKGGLYIPQPKITFSENSGDARRVRVTRHGVHLSLHYCRGHQQSIAKCLLAGSRASSSKLVPRYANLFFKYNSLNPQVIAPMLILYRVAHGRDAVTESMRTGTVLLPQHMTQPTPSICIKTDLSPISSEFSASPVKSSRGLFDSPRISYLPPYHDFMKGTIPPSPSVDLEHIGEVKKPGNKRTTWS